MNCFLSCTNQYKPNKKVRSSKGETVRLNKDIEGKLLGEI